LLVLSRASYALLVCAALSAIFMAARAADAEHWVKHSLEVRSQSRNLMNSMQDAIIRERGYLLTQDARYLRDFQDLINSLAVTRDTLQSSVADNADQSRRIADLKPPLSELATLLQNTVALVQSGDRDAAINVVRSNKVLEFSSDIRQRVTDFIGAEQALLTDRQHKASMLQKLLLAIIGVSLIAAAGLSVILEVSTRHFVRNLQSRTDELEAEIHRHQETGDTLRQAQKMEAVGQLTGGIAHDFNNLLTIIIGNLDTLKRQLGNVLPSQIAHEVAERMRNQVDTAIQAARNAGKLTHRLLAFARKQPLDPVRIDCNRLLSGMSELLRRTLGETVNLEIVLGGGLWSTFADSNQLESAILNLAVNARHAMPEGGRLTIETTNAYLDDAYVRRFGDLFAGQYVQISVADTGTGIPSEILGRVFEPFFTTKGAEAGSGLGLAMVHGFVKQTGGHVRIYSEMGHGSTVKIYLPRLRDADIAAAAPTALADSESPIPSSGTGETIFVVEDNDAVREYACATLEEMGYKVVEASSAVEAMKMVEAGTPFDLLFTDVVLPDGISGRQLSDKIQKLRPGMPVLYTTGYTRNAIVHHGRLDPDVYLLNKPYTQQDLARKLNELLQRSRKTLA
jgi:signal transduction histidine kinase/ActR/RegA family two-component response regulator